MPTTACLGGGGEPACTSTTTVENAMRPAPTMKSDVPVTKPRGCMEWVIDVESVKVGRRTNRRPSDIDSLFLAGRSFDSLRALVRSRNLPNRPKRPRCARARTMRYWPAFATSIGAAQ